MSRRRFAWLGIVALLALASLGSLCFGAYPVGPATALRMLVAAVLPGPLPAQPDWTPVEQVVVLGLRLPRVILALIAGAGLGLSGAALQGLFRNPLVSPDTTGVLTGAACGGVLAILLGLSPLWVTGLAFVGGIGAIAAAIGLARAAGGAPLSFVLAGVIVGAFFAAALTLMQFLADPITGLAQIMHWLMGGFAGATSVAIAVAGVPLLLAGAVLIGLRWRLNLLSLGDDDAAALGVRPAQLRFVVVAMAALIAAGQVAACGIVGWIGLLVPHLARMAVGPDHRRLLPAAAVIGSLFALVIDDLARAMTTYELPTSVLTAFIGTPGFAILLYRSRLAGWTRD